jgi:hypothetical protein
MWMKSAADDGLTALLFGPSEVSTTVKGVPVTIEEDTAYPFSDSITFRITAARPVQFPLRIRIPAWAGTVSVTAVAGATVETSSDLRVLTKTWQTGDAVMITFQNPILSSKCANDETAIYRGPLLYVLPWPSQRVVLKKSRGGVPEFFEWDVKPVTPRTSSGFYLDRNTPDAGFRAQPNKLYNRTLPWSQPDLVLTGMMRTGKNASSSLKPVTLFPLGSTMLRFASFPQAN